MPEEVFDKYNIGDTLDGKTYASIIGKTGVGDDLEKAKDNGIHVTYGDAILALYTIAIFALTAVIYRANRNKAFALGVCAVGAVLQLVLILQLIA